MLPSPPGESGRTKAKGSLGWAFRIKMHILTSVLRFCTHLIHTCQYTARPLTTSLWCPPAPVITSHHRLSEVLLCFRSLTLEFIVAFVEGTNWGDVHSVPRQRLSEESCPKNYHGPRKPGTLKQPSSVGGWFQIVLLTMTLICSWGRFWSSLWYSRVYPSTGNIYLTQWSQFPDCRGTIFVHQMWVPG